LQLLIDTDNMPTAELAAAINMLDDILQLRRTPQPAAENTEAAADVQKVIDSLGTPELPQAPPPPAAIPAPPATIADVVGDNDPEVEIDDEGTVTALTTSVQLQAPPPPPAAAPPTPVAPVVSAGIPAAAPVPPGPAVVAELDSRGYPWDGRIHASNRAKKIDGSWKNKRGVDSNLVVACEAQNKPGNAPSNAAPTPTAIAASATVIPVAQSPAAAPPVPTAPPPPPSTVGSAAPAAVAPAAIDFRGLMQKIQAGTAAGKLSTDQVNAALAGVGLKPEEMAQLIGNALYIASINSAIDKCLSS
jgi:hypothetical protein